MSSEKTLQIWKVVVRLPSALIPATLFVGAPSASRAAEKGLRRAKREGYVNPRVIEVSYVGLAEV